MTTSHNLGFPRIGERRELKKATEAYWAGDLDRAGLEAAGAEIRRANWEKQRAAGIDLIPSNDFSFYDQVLDMTCLVGNVPARFDWDGEHADLDLAFDMARGTDEAIACEMTKWFDTNYHYLVPEFTQNTTFKLAGAKVFEEFAEAKAEGLTTKPVLVGPATYLTLGKVTDGSGLDKFALADQLIPVYIEILDQLAAAGAEWVQIDEPVFSLDLNDAQRAVIDKTYAALSRVGDLKIMVTNYFGELRDNLELFTQLPVSALHIDGVRGAGEIEAVAARLPGDTALSLGMVDGRNIWKTDLAAAKTVLAQVRDTLGADRLMVGPACSLLHSPVTLRNETRLDQRLVAWLAFAEEKLDEIVALARAVDGEVDSALFEANAQAMTDRRESSLIHDDFVAKRVAGLTATDYQRNSVYAERARQQRAKLKLPMFPTTTIGSFPQTRDVRKARAAHKKGDLSDADYDAFLKQQIDEAIAMQEDMGFDMLVHGEFERNDMVEYFGEQLAGYVFTKLGWVQSYGSRYVKPPIIYGDVSRPKPMTVKWSKYAQSRTAKPMKGMLTGPVTMVQWAFVRDDQPRSETVKQVALAIRDEIVDLEAAGLAAIQCDEAAFREGLPLRRADWDEYLDWAAASFRLAAGGVRDDTQVHTHMCYSEFNDIIESIAAMDADCISIETSRSQMELLDAFVKFAYPNEIGPGVYDIHSPRVPSTDEMVALLEKAVAVLPAEKLWVNPDCGLKTRGWAEVKPALENMVEAAQRMRARIVEPA
ncbi:5-methyltetrahydropteroyltriglutamate--homocysteine S-methyltransferase [Salinisphaera hydrothermalis]|uniref:5-methyltetrahydropteroyltriglutamate--homocysteine methyltransferase n=1 Tax=Salinisphaera hydrothermalis (strain C41B8) TaxID=1304275 RepID=A0A084II60_SALHC|nr:5-methyltetrahydropteroyltriglutamate--homocysteine S-methyltransferase [Salinisphaera hydrothermalis]KEZ76394.1 5-methyltetrahydropteroyltriglutamate--homocysteine S-methyltransferase [Salinisphaera hydrothermalis C41B8]